MADVAVPSTPRRSRLGLGRWTPFWFLLPAVAALAAIGVYPTLFALVTSLRQYNIARVREGFPFVGLSNYAQVLSDPTFWQTLGRTSLFFACSVPFEVAIGLGVALLLHRPGVDALRALTRVALVIPLATTYAVVGLLGRLIFNRDFGIANGLLNAVSLPSFDWLGDVDGAFVAICIMDVWQWTPFCALIFLSGLSMVPPEIEEAAELETGSRWALLRHVQLPYLLPGFTAMLILRSADVLKLFDVVFTMTRGGPGAATELISIYIQRVGFRVFDLGLASAQAILLLVITVVLARLYIKFFYREID